MDCVEEDDADYVAVIACGGVADDDDLDSVVAFPVYSTHSSPCPTQGPA